MPCPSGMDLLPVAGVQVHGLPNAARKSKGKAVLLRNEEKTAAGVLGGEGWEFASDVLSENKLHSGYVKIAIENDHL